MPVYCLFAAHVYFHHLVPCEYFADLFSSVENTSLHSLYTLRNRGFRVYQQINSSIFDLDFNYTRGQISVALKGKLWG